MRQILSIIILTLLLGGCITTSMQIASQNHILKESKKLVKQQRWGEAQLLLERGTKWYPEDGEILQALAHVQDQWTEKKQRLEDWILVYETEGLLLKRPLLVSMSQSDPDDELLESRLKFLDSTLKTKRDLLIRCTEYQISKDLKLARRCIEAAKRIRESTEVKTLLAQIQSIQSGIKKKKQALNLKATTNSILTQARTHLQEKAYYDAIKVLEPLFALDDQEPEVKLLMEEAITGRELQVLQLISHGDRLYREEYTMQALVVWKQAAVLNPDHDGLSNRIKRAQKVLGKLEEIRSKE